MLSAFVMQDCLFFLHKHENILCSEEIDLRTNGTSLGELRLSGKQPGCVELSSEDL
jgi:hypothetical protein